MTQKKSSNDEDVKIEEPEIEVKVEGDGALDGEPVEVKEPKEPVKEPEKEPEDVQALRKQIEDLQTAQKNSQLEAQRQAREAQAQLDSMRQANDHSQYDTIVTAIGAAQMEIDSAKRDIVLAGSAQDFGALADAQERLAAAKAHMIGLEQGKTSYEQQWQTQQQQPVDPIENMRGLSYEEKNWLRAHPDALHGAKNARLNAAYFDAMDEGIQRGTPRYFEFIEEKLGYREKPMEKKEPAPAPEVENSAMVAAPPSNNVPSGAGSGRKPVYTLTKEEAEIAKLSGITPQEYAKQREIFKNLRKQNPDDYPRG